MITDTRTVVRLEELGASGEAIARIDGKLLFVSKGSPGDLVAVSITQEKKNWARATILEILEEGPDRQTPTCPHYAICGGCTLQHIPIHRQEDYKKRQLLDVMKRIGKLECIPEIKGVSSPAEYAYRNRMQLHRVKGTTGKHQLGLVSIDGTTLFPLQRCPIADKRIQDALASNEIKIPPTSDRFTIYGKSDVLLCEGAKERGKINLAGKDILLDVRGFFQSNADCLELLITDLLDLAHSLPRRETLLDMYCGVGTFSLYLAPLFATTEMVEQWAPAIALARENTRTLSCQFSALSDKEWTRGASTKQFDLIIADPPRTGMGDTFIDWLCCQRPTKKLAYVSCDAATLARDCARLCASGYILEQLRMYDFYPQTAHIESLAVFSCNR